MKTDDTDNHCQALGCLVTWRDNDACLLNFSPAGQAPFWLCRAHHPDLKDGASRPVGWAPPEADTEAKRVAGLAALAKLTPAERSLVNGRIINTGEKPSTTTPAEIAISGEKSSD